MLILSGKSCSGKDTIIKELLNLGYKRLITFTTRPAREGEIDGETYYYIATTEFLKKYIDGDFLEVNYYTTKKGIWFYGSQLSDYEKADNQTVCILTPSGLSKLKEKDVNFTSFLIDVSDEEIIKRQLKRKDDLVEAERRFKADKIVFADCDKLMDYTINNENRDAKEVAEEIDKIYRITRN